MPVRRGPGAQAAAPGAHSRGGSFGGRWAAFAIGCLMCFVWFAKTYHTPLVHPDEGRYAEIAREMLASGDWLTPRLNGLKYFEKPPLQYWATAVAYQLFGISEWSARLWVALTGLACVVATWFAARRLFSVRAGSYGALLLLASPYFVIASSVNSLDMGVACFLNIAVFAYLLSRHPGEVVRARWWMLVAWGAMALAVMSKGLIGVVLPALALAGYVVWTRDGSAVRRLEWVFGPLLFLAISAPWFIEVARANPEFARFFFIHEHIDRFTSTSHRRTGPIWYFLPILIFAVVPWIVACGRGLAAAARGGERHGGFDTRRFLLVWCGVVFVFFSLSQSKLPGYLLPIVPALAVLASSALASQEGRRHAFWLAVGALVFGVAAFAANEFLEARTLEHLQSRYETFNYWAEAASVAFIVAAAVALYWVDRVPDARIVIALSLAIFLTTCGAVYGYREFAPSRSAIAIARAIDASGARSSAVYSVRMYDQTLAFYLRRTVVLVDYVDEFALGEAAEPGKAIRDLDEFMRRWRETRDAFALMPIALYEELRSQDMPMERLLTERERVLVRHP